MFTYIRQMVILSSACLIVLPLLGSCAVRIHIQTPAADDSVKLLKHCELTKWPSPIELPKLDIPAYEAMVRVNPVAATSMLTAHIKELRNLIKDHARSMEDLRQEYESVCR